MYRERKHKSFTDEHRICRKKPRNKRKLIKKIYFQPCEDLFDTRKLRQQENQKQEKECMLFQGEKDLKRRIQNLESLIFEAISFSFANIFTPFKMIFSYFKKVRANF